MRTVHEIAEYSGVSVRTLHYYDQIGLLPPSHTTPAGYRYYDDSALERLQQILFFREIGFPLKDIRAILESPSFDKTEALRQQLTLLTHQQEHLSRLIATIQTILTTGVNTMDFTGFDISKIEAYRKEAREKWGDTAAMQEFEKKQVSNADFAEMNRLLLEQFKHFAAVRTQGAASDAAQQQVCNLQAFITAHYYTCTNDILSSLGQMYTGDERFLHNIDAYAGEGTAAFASEAIAIYCKKA